MQFFSTMSKQVNTKAVRNKPKQSLKRLLNLTGCDYQHEQIKCLKCTSNGVKVLSCVNYFILCEYCAKIHKHECTQ